MASPIMLLSATCAFLDFKLSIHDFTSLIDGGSMLAGTFTLILAISLRFLGASF